MKGEPKTGAVGEPGDREGQLAGLADEALLEHVRAGDERAFETLVLRYRLPLRSYCVRLGVPADGAEDVLQQALLEAWIALRHGVEVHAFKAWLYRIAHNVAVDAIHATPRVAALSGEQAEQTAAAGMGMFEPGIQEALTAVAALPLLQREAIVRTAIAGESHEQVGRYLGLTAGAVRGLIYRGRATLRSALAALVPPWLPRLIASRSSAGGGLRESLSGLATSAGSTSSAGVLVKAGVIAAVAATAITSAMPGHATRSHRHHGSAPAATRSRSDGPGGSTHELGAAAAVGASQSQRIGGGARSRPRAGHPTGLAQASSTPTIAVAHVGTQPSTSRSQSSAATQAQTGATQQAAPQATVSATTAATASPGSTSGSAGAETASQTPRPGAASETSAQPTSPSSAGSTSSASSEQASAASGSSSGEHGGPVGELVHTVENALETTVEDTLGKLLRK